MIPSIDTYIYTEINKRLKVILNECYIIDEALGDIDEDAKENFKKTYFGKDAPKKVQISYQFPQSKTFSEDALYVIQLGGGSEMTKSIGGVEGTYDYRQDQALKEYSTAVKEADELYLEVKRPIGSFEGSPHIAFSSSDNMRIEGNRIYFRYDSDIEGATFEVFYTAKIVEDKDPVGAIKGFTSRDSVNIVGLSTNYDTARCLDAILKLILITMRDSMEEQTYYGLQSLDFADMQPVIATTEQPIFGRPVTLQFIVSYGVNLDFIGQINQFIIKGGY